MALSAKNRILRSQNKISGVTAAKLCRFDSCLWPRCQQQDWRNCDKQAKTARTTKSVRNWRRESRTFTRVLVTPRKPPKRFLWTPSAGPQWVKAQKIPEKVSSSVISCSSCYFFYFSQFLNFFLRLGIKSRCRIDRFYSFVVSFSCGVAAGLIMAQEWPFLLFCG